MTPQPNWDDLRLFLAVARCGSLSEAGRSLRLDPATLGRRIRRLEGALGTVLFVRTPRGYGLTPAGERLLQHAEQAESAVLALRADSRAGSGALTGPIRIGAPDGVANYLLPQVVAGIVDANPGLDVQIVALPRVFNLSRREADMAITVSPPEAGRLSVQKLADYRLHLAASRDYLARHGPIRSLDDLKGHRLIGYIPDMIFDRALDYLDVLGEGAQAALTSNAVTVQLQWARLGAGLCIAHDFAIPALPGLVRVLTDQVSLTRSFHLVRHADDRRVARLGRFAALLVPAFRRELARLEALA